MLHPFVFVNCLAFFYLFTVLWNILTGPYQFHFIKTPPTLSYFALYVERLLVFISANTPFYIFA